MTSSFAIIASEYPDNMQTMIGVLETVGGIGLILGPLIGSSIFFFLGFSGVFAVTSLIYLLMVPICGYLMDKDAPYVEKQKSSIW